MSQFWALKTTRSSDLENSFWPNFLAEGVIAIGWERIDVDPSQVSDRQLREAIKRAYPSDHEDRGLRETDPAGATRKIKMFVDLCEGDKVLICRGYAWNSTRHVHIYGFARVTGPFRVDRRSSWRWHFKHNATIQRVERDLTLDEARSALGRDSFIGTILRLDEDSFNRVAAALKVQVQV